MYESEQINAYESCVASIDDVVARHRKGIITRVECVQSIFGALHDYLRSDQFDDDFGLLLAYARLPFEQRADDPLGGDHAALEEFDREVRVLLHRPSAEADLTDLLRAAGHGLPDGPSQTTIEELTELCAHGHVDHPRIFMFRHLSQRVLRAAAIEGAVSALEAAISPTGDWRGQIGHPAMHHGVPRRLAFDLLAQLATDMFNQASAHALDVLVTLTAYPESAELAVVRLPAHRLTTAHRERLLENLDAFTELLDRDPVLIPRGGSERVPPAIRSVLWLANDADKAS